VPIFQDGRLITRARARARATATVRLSLCHSSQHAHKVSRARLQEGSTKPDADKHASDNDEKRCGTSLSDRCRVCRRINARTLRSYIPFEYRQNGPKTLGVKIPSSSAIERDASGTSRRFSLRVLRIREKGARVLDSFLLRPRERFRR